MFLAALATKWAKRRGDENWPASDHELVSRVHVTGSIDLGFLEFHFWEMPNLVHGAHDERACWLGLADPPHEEVDRPPYGKDGSPQYYLRGHIPSEFALLLTLFSRRHFVYRRTLKSQGRAFMHYASTTEVARGPFDGRDLFLPIFQPQFERAIAFASADPARAGRLMLAAKFYHLALPHITDDHDLAFLFLTSAIEPLLHDYDPDGIDLDAVNSELAALLRSKLTDKDYQAAEDFFLNPLPRIKARFVRFILDHLREDFWSDPTRPEYKLERDELAEMLNRIYKARSRLLHDGLALPPQHHFDSERPFGLAVMAGNRRWEERELLPHARTYERIVHHVLMGYFERHAPI